MKNCIVLASSVTLALVVSAGLGVRASAAHHDSTLHASLTGFDETPPIASRGFATLRASLNEAAQAITFTLDYRNLTANPTVAHIHFGQSRVNGGVMVFLCGGGGKPACPAATSGTVIGIITAADVVGITAQGIAAGDFASVAHAIRTSNSYVNIHNNRFPNGEIRGQVFTYGYGRWNNTDDADQ